MNCRSIFVALAISLGVPACVGSGTMRVSGSATGVVYTEPPQARVETITVVRPGHVWVKGHWDWQNGQWSWIDGHWERERAGYAWTEGRWERRGNAWHWIEGRWTAGGSVTVDTGGGGNVEVRDHRDGGGTVEVRDHRDAGGGGTVEVRDHRDGGGGATVVIDVNGDYPNVAPPAVRVESYGAPRRGFLWVAGRWDWKRGQGWVWLDGHWERERANKAWVAGRWELQGNRWVWIEGGWR